VTRLERQELPINRARMPNGAIRYWVPIRMEGGPQIGALLDTGSFGLRTLAIDRPAPSGGERRSYEYASGVRIEGPVEEASIALGDGKALTIPVHFVDEIGCVEGRPNCPAANLSLESYRFGGSGVPNSGFPAIIGIAMPQPGGEPSWVNPLTRTATSWIVEAPRASERSGRLILNPTPAERRGFTRHKLNSAHMGMPAGANNAIEGCVTVGSDPKTCGMMILDLGANGIRVVSHEVSTARTIPEHVPVELQIMDRRVRFNTGSRYPLDQVSIAPSPEEGSKISAGALPFMFFSVLYDSKKGTIGIKPRG
jgi:hypothetical protein